MIELAPWFALAFWIAAEQIYKDWKSSREWREHKRIVAMEYDCLFPDDPCDTPNPVRDLECDNCVRYGCRPTPRSGREE